jgi:membrane-associated phospholipid phosphatase
MAADGAAAIVVTPDRVNDSRPALGPRSERSFLRFLAYAAPFLLAALCYEILRRTVQYRGEVHVGDLYDLEARLFPAHLGGQTLAWSEVIARHHNAVLDVICGGTYLLFLPELFGMAALMFFRDRPRMLALAFGFLFANLIGWSIWLVYPAAPPWYVDAFGKGSAILSTPSNAAGLARLDSLLGLPIAGTFYAGSANVFGAMPSLHVAYATIVACVVWPLRGSLRVITLLFAVSMAFSAVYLRHHYILDVVAGLALAFPVAWFSIWSAERLDRMEFSLHDR